MSSNIPSVAVNGVNNDDRFVLEIDIENRCYNVFDLNIKCSTDALKTFHRCSDSILERDPELYNIWIDDHRFYSHAIVEVIENELNSLHYKCLFSNLKPLQGFRWLEGLLLVIGSYSKYLDELNDNDRLDALLNLFYSAWITFFIHNRYAILTLSCPTPLPDANNNNNECIIVDNHDKKVTNVSVHKTEEQIARHLDKHLPNFDRILSEAIEIGHQLSSKRLPNLEKFEEFYQLWKNPLANKRKSLSTDFSLILERITNDIDLTSSSDETNFSPKKSINWKMVFYDEFTRYADRFYLTKKTSLSKRRTIGGERFSINKWSSNKINYFLTKNILKRNSNHEYEKQIEQLYQ
ncbi:unnamed protein product [Rotaria sordida]|nr:unnamed protein product [Rotaria sordida]CAF1159651.1 unnamed protein product [Rotaria sordida]CAF1197578.1 unnamed protein product [Rotaria sordida]CAF3534678.1 unnamed protein product [Rotaria sordida]CAF3779098.1 unnamed protein product [Rotaria sordida]